MSTFKTLVLSLFLLAPVYAWPQDRPLFEEPVLQKALWELDKSVVARFSKMNTPGMAIALVHGQQVIWTKTLGHASLATKAPVTTDTSFRIGSITKLFTATMLMQLRDKGALSLDQSAESFLPITVKHVDDDARPVTFRTLVSHTSGFPPEGGDYWERMSIPTIDKLYAANQTLQLQSSPLSSMSYSNFGIAVLGDILARVAGVPYEDYVETKILKPLNMTSTSFSPPARGAIATGYATTGREHVPVEPVDLNALSPAGQAYSTVLDLAKFVTAQFPGGAPSQSRLLRTASLREMQQPVFLFPDFRGRNPVGLAIGIGWFIRDIGGYRAVGHGGGIPGYTSDVTLVPGFRLGVVTLTNGGAGPGTDPSSFNRDVLEKIIPVIDSIERERRLRTARFDRHWSKYLGDYDMVGVATLSVAKQGSYMVFAHPLDQADAKGILIPVEENVFAVEGGAASGATVRFAVDETGKVTGLVIAGILSRKL